ncbi:hypothetical protein [Telluribacter humicola]|uniref:hypothetical protein n=1 Tax=Telluribacter humicola TaxID=1720261 RepID=UPI001A95B408|nr:hypothetical protein [Telluribacter humicola]
MKKLTSTLKIALLGVLPLMNPVQGATAPQIHTDSTQTSPRKPTLLVGMYRSIHSLTMNVLVEKPIGEKVSVTLLNKKGKVLCKEVLSVRKSRHWLKLNFAEIQDDTFSVVVTNGTDQITKSIHLSTQRLYEMPARTLLVMN